MQKWPLGTHKGLCNRAKNACTVKKCRFFKVGDTLTTMLPRKKKHLTEVISPLKTFHDHLRSFGNNLKIPQFQNFLVSVLDFPPEFLTRDNQLYAKIENLQNISKTSQIVMKRF